LRNRYKKNTASQVAAQAVEQVANFFFNARIGMILHIFAQFMKIALMVVGNFPLRQPILMIVILY
jgi:hypothetical protein